MPEETLQDCACTIQKYGPIIFNNIAYQNAANMIYDAKNATVIASQNGTLGTSGNGQPTFKSNYERMQYLAGKQSRASCGARPKMFSLGRN